MTKEYQFILDTREKNQKLLELVDDENTTLYINNKEPAWTKKRLTLSFFVKLPEGTKDRDCGDVTNENGDGIVELKEFGDLINSTTGDGVHHLHEQSVKMHSTGIPFAIIIYGSRTVFQKRSGVSDSTVVSGLQKLASIACNYKVTVIQVKDEREALDVSKTFIRKCRELPRRMPVYNLLKNTTDEAIASLCGFETIGEKNARVILEKWGSLYHFYQQVFKGLDSVGLSLTVESICDQTPGLGPAHARKILEGLVHDISNEVKKNDRFD